MNIADVIGFADRLKLVQGVENDLRARRRIGTWAGLAAIVLQVLVVAVDKNYLEKLGRFLFNLSTRRWADLVSGDQRLHGYELLAALALIGGTTAFVLVRRTRFLLRDSKEPFRYTFSVDPFLRVSIAPVTGEAPAEALTLEPSGRFRLLHHDLMDKLSSNIGRLSLLNVSSLPNINQRDLSSHIHISGHYLVRNPERASSSPSDISKATVEIMARIRIGPPDRPEQLAPRITLSDIEIQGSQSDSDYAQIVEHVYSRIATAVYQRIREDIRNKINLYPTPYVRAVGLFYEAEDFEQSNTVDAYDHAIDLYREALRYFDFRRIRTLSRWFLGKPVLWRMVNRPQLLEARARVAYCRCLINRRIVSALSGRRENPLFEVPDQLEKAVLPLESLYACSSQQKFTGGPESIARRNAFALIARYLTYPRDAAASRRRPIFDENRQALFEAYVVSSLAYSQLGALERARSELRLAFATAPDVSERSPLYLLAVAETIADLNQKLHFLLKASELAPASEIVKYQLAQSSNRRFRLRNELSPERAKPIIDSFKAVQRINPGNIGAYAANGYLWWLLKDNDEAAREYRAGLSVKAIRQQTFVGDLNYGLARIAAEAGGLSFNVAFDLYVQAVSADPGVGAATETRPLNEYYEYMTDSMLARYAGFVNRVRAGANAIKETGTDSGRPVDEKATTDSASREVSERTRNAVLSFALNDYANACFQYHIRTGQVEFVDRAVTLYEEAIRLNPESAVAYYNLSSALSWTSGRGSESPFYLEKAEKLAPSWLLLLTQSIETNLRHVATSIRDMTDEAKRLKQEIAELTQQNQFLAMAPADLPRPSAMLQGGYGVTGGVESEARQRVRSEAELEAQRQAAQSQQIKRDIESKNAQVVAIEQTLRKLRDSRQTRMVEKLKKILGLSGFAGFFEGLDIDDLGGAVKRFLETPIRKDQLDEGFVDLLRLWALLLSTETEHEEILSRCMQLSRYILTQFYPEHFRVHLTLLDLYSRLPDLQENRRGRIDSLWAVRSAIDDSLSTDPSRWFYLDWALGFFEGELFHLKTAVRSALNEMPVGGQWGSIKRNLSNVFWEQGVCLSGGARGQTVEKEHQWEISDGDGTRKYSLRQEGKDDSIVVRFAGRGIVETLSAAVENLDDVSDKKKLAVLNSLLAKQYATIGNDVETVKQYEDAIRNNPQNVSYLVSLGDHHYQKLRYDEAELAYSRASSVDPTNHLYFGKLALAEEALASSMKDAGKYWRRAVKALQKAAALAPDKTEYLNRLKHARLEAYLGGALMFPVVTPVAVEFGGRSPMDDPDGRASWEERYGKMRATIESELGVRIPLARWRSEETLPQGEYRILINEIPDATGNILGLSDLDPMALLIQHLNAVLRQRPVDFFGHQEVMNTLELSDPELYRYYLSHSEQLTELVLACGALLQEHKPVVGLADIARKIMGGGISAKVPLPEVSLESSRPAVAQADAS
jgi:tetratricopeptide (TPR) repeat protein